MYSNRLGKKPIIWHSCGLVPHVSGEWISGLERGRQDKRNTMWDEIVRWATSLDIPPDPLTDVIVINNKAQSVVEKQLIKNNQPHMVFGQQHKEVRKWSHIFKLELLLEAAKLSTKPYIATMDAFDVVYSGCLIPFRESLGDKKMHVSADIMKWPPDSPGKEKINAGVWIAEREYAISWLEKAVAASKTRKDVKNDQYWYIALFDAENQKIDYGRDFVQTEIRPQFVKNDFIKYCRLINLKHRTDRWAECKKQFNDFPFIIPERFEALKGWCGMDGCKKSHMQVIREAQALEKEHVFILEDDFVLCPNFTQRISLFLEKVPDDWDILWIGGYHNKRPTPINDYVSKVERCVNCHAYIVRDRMYQPLLDFWSGIGNQHIDNTFQYEMPKYNIYCPKNFLIGQAGGLLSDISGQKREKTNFWSKVDEEIHYIPDRIDLARKERLG